MASPAEQLFYNLKYSSLKNNRKLRQNLLFLFGAFFVIRLGSFIPLAGVNNGAWNEFWINSPFAHLTGLL